METETTGNKVATDGHIFVCCACGKTSTWRYGFDNFEKRTSTQGWDESCMLNAQEFPLEELVWNESKTRVIEIKGKTKVPHPFGA